LSCSIIVADIRDAQPLNVLIGLDALPPQWYLHGHLLFGGTAGSALVRPVLAHDGCAGTCTIGAGLPLLALIYFIPPSLRARKCLI
jgi:hypothetical protein